MIFRIFPSKDTWITDDFRHPNYTRLTASNLGASEELDVFKRAGISGADGLIGSSSLGRILVQFDLGQYTALTSSGELASAGVTFHLRMNHKTASTTRPSSYDLTIKPVSSSWDEGEGQDVHDLGDDGFANWDRRTSTSFWATPGGDYVTSPTASFHFDTGIENMEVDVTSIVNGWLSGTFPNNGLGIMMTASIESNAVYVDYFQKKFYSRQSDFDDRRPYLEIRFGDSTRDDRTNVQWARTGTLYLYNAPGGVFQNLPGNFVTVAIADSSGVLVHLTASRGTAVGIYSASFALPTGAFSTGRPYSGSLFYDRWGSGSFAFSTGTFTPTTVTPVNSIVQYPLTARIRNMQDEYVPEDVAVLEVLFRRRPHVLPVVQTASLGQVPYIVEQAYYAIENDSTRERVIPFGTGSQHHTRLSYGEGGNSFKLYMRNLHAGNAYRVLFLVYEQGRQQVIDGGFRFRVI